MVLLFVRCAQVAPLTGGERDLTPPKLLEAKPANATTNFSASVIELRFDEFVQVKDISNQLVITPQTKEMPLVEARGKKVIVKFNESLLPNTTYRIFFGNSVADMHESNVLGNFEYVFSTGSYIDSLWITGKILNAFTLSPEKEVMVGLYDVLSSDSVLYKSKPLYFTKSSDDGNYRLSYLPKSDFKIFAFSDKNKNLMYDGGDEMVGFKDTITRVSKDTVVNFKVFKEIPAKQYIKKVTSPYYGLCYVVYNKDVLSSAKLIKNDLNGSIFSEEAVNDTCTIYYQNIFDTLKVGIRHSDKSTDTIKIPVLSKERFEKLVKEKKIAIGATIPDEAGKLPYYKDPVVRFNHWIDSGSVDVSRIELSSKVDSMISKDPRLTYKSADEFVITAKLQAETSYFLSIHKGAFKTNSGIENDSMKLSFSTSSPEDYGKLTIKLLLPKKENYLVQLLNEKTGAIVEEYIQLSLTSSAEQLIILKHLLPGNYFIKVIEDKNKNKIWDTGDLMSKDQPEPIYFNPQVIKIPAGWDSEIEWNVN
jgi:hypothetical protein